LNYTQTPSTSQHYIKDRRISGSKRALINNQVNTKVPYHTPVQKIHFESVEDSIIEESLNGSEGVTKISNFYQNTPTISNKYNSAYFSDDNSSGKFIPKIDNKISLSEARVANIPVIVPIKWKNPLTYFENSYDNPPNILVNDNDQLHVIKE
jgi:hypothetical protein